MSNFICFRECAKDYRMRTTLLINHAQSKYYRILFINITLKDMSMKYVFSGNSHDDDGVRRYTEQINPDS